MNDNEERFTYAGRSGRVTQTGGRYNGPLIYERVEHTGREIGSHTKANVRNDSQPVSNAPVSGFNEWVKPAGTRPVGPGDAGKPAPFHIAGTYASEPEAHAASQQIAMQFGGQPVQVLVLSTDLYPLPDGTIRPTTDNDFGEAREIARGTEDVGRKLSPWLGNIR